ncbi:uncharacterized protein DDB_G0284459-like [Anopheles ziemanni]|uniref:uncharacterized protein DDB_G0284459-like n=1 Tax=Anopheles coustani TaxID=139045 RepID=UPI00265AD31B|nr:uncharacterized protein DDB_G0284459-like [Anopheles coustani]XP_058171608.1 uncharacterized protein DDB_G0284459-like [Anopheles ziemanni]
MMWKLLNQFPVPLELKDGIIYCQRALRDCVVQHQNLASKINKLPKHQRIKVKELLLELEEEMLEIGDEQDTLVRSLSQRLQAFRAYVQQKTNVNITDDIANGYVTRVLHYHNETTGPIATPASCSNRLSANELAQKYCLENIAKLEKFINDDNANFAPWSTGTSHEQRAEEKKSKKIDTKTIKAKANLSCSSSSTSPSPMTTSGSRSLLKPKQERFPQGSTTSEPSSKDASEPRAFASVIKSEESTNVKVTEVKNEPSSNQATTAMLIKNEPEPTEDKPEPQKLYTQTGKRSWMPGLRGRPPKGVKYIPAAKHALQAAQRENYLRRMQQAMLGVKQRGRPPKMPIMLPSPPPEPEPEQHDSSEEQSGSSSFGRPSVAVRRGRSNLQMALNRLKRLPDGENTETFINRTATEIAKKSKPTTGGKQGSSGSSGSSPSSRSSTPTLSQARLAASDDSSDRRCDMAPPESPPTREPEVPPPNDIWELGMKALLNYFGLCTPEEAKARRERRQERKRRSCYSTERKDFHYGRLDYYEQQQLQAAVRTSKRPNQRPILYSPPVAVVKKRKHQMGAVAGAVALASSNARQRPPPMPCRLSLDSRDIFAAMARRSCFVCNKTGSTIELSACTNCCNIYHISCHRNEAESDLQLFQLRDNLCPVCLTAECGDDGDK